jgi:hypothetical protein
VTPFDAAAYWLRRHAETPGLRAVGNHGCTEEDLAVEYDEKHATLCCLLRALSPDSVLEVGFGQGLGALACAATGVEWYHGIDIAAPMPAGPWPPGYSFARCAGQDLGPADVDLVLCLDVAYHVIDDDAFTRILATMRESAPEAWVTDRPAARVEGVPPHMRLRGLDAYAPLGELVERVPWSDLELWRFRRM